MSWQDDCDSPVSRYSASRGDDDFNDVEFDVHGLVKMKANRTILSMASPVLKAQFYGPFAVKMGVPVIIDDGTPGGFKTLLDFIYNEGEYSIEDLLGAKGKITNKDDLKKVMELLYFGHKYQINSLVSFGRRILMKEVYVTRQNVLEIHREIIEYKTILNFEYCIVNFYTKNLIERHFIRIFKDAKITDEVFLTEDLMVDILKSQTLRNASEELVLKVALDYVRFCKDRDVNKNEERTWKEMAKRIIPNVINFSKLSLQEVDLTLASTILPDDVLLKMQTEMIDAFKNGLRLSGRRCEEKTDMNVFIVKKPLQLLSTKKRSQIKFKVNKSCCFTFVGPIQCCELNHFGNPHFCHCRPYEQIVWKQKGVLKQFLRGQDKVLRDGKIVHIDRELNDINYVYLFAEPNKEITVEFEMTKKRNTFMMEYPINGGPFRKDNVEIQILEVNGKPFNKALGTHSIKRKHDQRGGTISEEAEGVHFSSLTFFPI